MTKIWIVAVLLSAGCTAEPEPTAPRNAPTAENQELALQIVWDDVYGMAGKRRPSITWWVACDVPGGADFANPGGVCYADTVRPDLTIDARWYGSFTDARSTFVIDLFYAKGWALYGESQIEAQKEPLLPAKARAALQAAGL
jgi:hypothetical protein